MTRTNPRAARSNGRLLPAVESSILCPRCLNRFIPLYAPGDAATPCPKCGNVLWRELAGTSQDSRQCRSCSEWIPLNAHLCRFCREPQDFQPDSQPKPGGLITWLKSSRPSQARYVSIQVERVIANPYQPREDVDVGSPEFEYLARSIEAYGVIVPIIVSPKGRKYILVAGQRRLAACRSLGLRRIPALVRPLTALQIIEVSYLENLHRKDLSGVEQATVFQRLTLEQPQLPRSELCKRLGRNPRTVARETVLVGLPSLLREAVKRGLLSEDHALRLQGVRNEQRLLEIIKRVYVCRLSLEETSQMAQEAIRATAFSAGA